MIKKIIAINLFILCCSLSMFSQSRLKAEIYAQTTAEQIKNRYTPTTGYNVRSTISDMEFDYAENEYIIKMTAYWDARGCVLCSYKPHSISGILIYNTKSRVTQFKTLSKNEGVLSTETWIAATGFAIGAIVILNSL